MAPFFALSHPKKTLKASTSFTLLNHGNTYCTNCYLHKNMPINESTNNSSCVFLKKRQIISYSIPYFVNMKNQLVTQGVQIHLASIIYSTPVSCNSIVILNNNRFLCIIYLNIYYLYLVNTNLFKWKYSFILWVLKYVK